MRGQLFNWSSRTGPGLYLGSSGSLTLLYSETVSPYQSSFPLHRRFVSSHLCSSKSSDGCVVSNSSRKSQSNLIPFLDLPRDNATYALKNIKPPDGGFVMSTYISSLSVLVLTTPLDCFIQQSNIHFSRTFF